MADAARISSAMREMDADGDGKVSYDEFITAVVDRQLVHHQNMCVAAAERGARVRRGERGAEPARRAHAVFALCSLRAAHRHSLSRPPPLAPARRIWFAFCEYDLDGDGKITRDELSRALAMHGEPPEKVAAYISEFDSNGDGHIDYEEFMRMLLPKDVKVRCAQRVRRAPTSARARAPLERPANQTSGACARAPSRRPHAPSLVPAAPSAQFRVKHELNEVVSVSRAKADAEAAAARLAEVDSAATRLAAAAAEAEEAVVEAAVAAGVAPEEL